MANEPIVLERLFNAPATNVWRALTDKNEMKLWYFDLADFKAEVGFRFEFTGGPSPDKQYLHLCEVIEVIPGMKITYSWRYEGYAGNSLVTFELFPQKDKTLLKLSHAGLETFPADIADFAVSNFEEGWNAIIHSSLKDYLEKE